MLLLFMTVSDGRPSSSVTWSATPNPLRGLGFLTSIALGQTLRGWQRLAGWSCKAEDNLIELGGFMLAFAVAQADDGATPLVIAVACAVREEIEVERFWTSVVEPRIMLRI